MTGRRKGGLGRIWEHFGFCILAVVQLVTVAGALLFAATIKHH
jgi:hypothetical protein